MKKIITLFLLLVFMLCGCNQPHFEQNQSKKNQQTETNNSSSENQQINTSSKSEPQNSVTYPNVETCSYTVHSSLPKYEIKIEYISKKKASYIALYKENENTEIQRFDLEDNERFTKKAIYVVDVTFDGYADVLVPRERPASAIYFMAFVWDTKTNKLVYAPTFETFGNICLDTDNKLLLSKASGDMTTTYKIGNFDENLKDFKKFEVFNYYVNEEYIYYREQKLENGEMKTVADYKFPYNEKTDNAYTLHPTISDKYTKNSHWDLNSSKWENYLISSSELYY